MNLILRVVFIVGLLLMAQLQAAPLVTSVTLGAGVSSTHVVAVATPNMRPVEYVLDSTESSIFVMPGTLYGDAATAAPPDYSPGPTYSSSNSPLLGNASGYGALLMQFKVDASDLSTIGANFPTNSNESVLSAASGPINTDNLSLVAAGIAAGTAVTMTVDMQSELPHLVAVMSGSYPTISFDSSGTGTLTIAGTTTASFANKAGQDFSSSFGFMVVTDNVVATAPDVLGVIAQSDHWIGDMFPLLPGLDNNAAITGGGGTLAASTARSGLSMAGPCGETRSVNLFVATGSLAALYGAGTTPADLTGFINDTEQAAVTSSDMVNFNAAGGTKVTLDYDFPPDSVDVGVGVSGSTVGTAPSVCAVSSSGVRLNSGGGSWTYPEIIFCLVAGLFLFYRRRTHWCVSDGA